MRKFKLSLLLFTGIYLLAGCIAENMDGCFDDPPPVEQDGSLTILFTYSTDTGKDEFLDRVEVVNLVIFSEDGLYVEDHVLNYSHLSEFQGTTLELDAGIYYAVCWGNLSSNSSLPSFDPNTTTLQNAKLYLNSETTADPIYYGPRKTSTESTNFEIYKIEIPEIGEEEKIIDFMTAYYTVNVYVKGFERVDNVNRLPMIEMRNLPESYDFHLAYGFHAANLRQQSVRGTVSGEEVGQSSFHTTHFDVQNAININIIKPTNQETAYTVNLQEVLVANDYILTMGEHVTIDVFVEFKSNGLVEVSLSLPGWGGNIVEPGI